MGTKTASKARTARVGETSPTRSKRGVAGIPPTPATVTPGHTARAPRQVEPMQELPQYVHVEKVTRGGVHTGWRGRVYNPTTQKWLKHRDGKASATFPRYDDAAAWAIKLQQDHHRAYADAGVPIQHTRRRPGFTEYAWLWHSGLEKTIATRRGKASHIRAWVQVFGDELRVDEITATAVSAYMLAMRDGTYTTTQGRPGTPLRNATRSTRLRVLRQIIAAAIRDGYLAEDPTEGMEEPDDADDPKFAARIIDEGEALSAAAHMPEPGAGGCAKVLLGFDSGLRIGEVAAVRRCDLYLDGPKPHAMVAQTIGPDGVPKKVKGKQEKTVPLSRRTVDALRAHLAERPCIGEARLFEDPWAIREQWARACELAGLTDPRPRFHDLRHACATWLARAGVNIRKLQRFMRHENINTTQRYILEASLEEMDDLADLPRRQVG